MTALGVGSMGVANGCSLFLVLRTLFFRRRGGRRLDENIRNQLMRNLQDELQKRRLSSSATFKGAAKERPLQNKLLKHSRSATLKGAAKEYPPQNGLLKHSRSATFKSAAKTFKNLQDELQKRRLSSSATLCTFSYSFMQFLCIFMR